MMTAARRVLFVVAAGPRVGFGHLRRSRALSRALLVPHVVALRGSKATARAARAMGATLVAYSATAFTAFGPDLVVIDDPSLAPARQALSWARRCGVPVASVHDLGRAYINSDLRVDASLTAPADRAELSGPAFAILDANLLSLRAPLHTRMPGRVLIALGGGAHVRRYGATIARAICDALPDAHVVVAPGFEASAKPALPNRAVWLNDPSSLATELARASVVVTGGGVTLAEGCAVGAPMVAVAVAASQRATIEAFAAAGAAFDAGHARSRADLQRIVAGVLSLSTSPTLARRLSTRANATIDGRGAFRVAAYLSGIVRRAGGHAHAA